MGKVIVLRSLQKHTHSEFTKILKQGRINNLILSSKLAVHFAPFGVLNSPKTVPATRFT